MAFLFNALATMGGAEAGTAGAAGTGFNIGNALSGMSKLNSLTANPNSQAAQGYNPQQMQDLYKQINQLRSTNSNMASQPANTTASNPAMEQRVASGALPYNFNPSGSPQQQTDPWSFMKTNYLNQ